MMLLLSSLAVVSHAGNLFQTCGSAGCPSIPFYIGGSECVAQAFLPNSGCDGVSNYSFKILSQNASMTNVNIWTTNDCSGTAVSSPWLNGTCMVAGSLTLKVNTGATELCTPSGTCTADPCVALNSTQCAASADCQLVSTRCTSKCYILGKDDCSKNSKCWWGSADACFAPAAAAHGSGSSAAAAIIIIILVVLIAIAAAAGVYFFVLKKNDSSSPYTSA